MCPHEPVCLLYLLHLQPLPTIGTVPSTCTHVLAFSVPKIKIKKKTEKCSLCLYLFAANIQSLPYPYNIFEMVSLLAASSSLLLILSRPTWLLPSYFINNFILVRTTGHFWVLFPKYFLVCLTVLTIPFLLKLYSFGYHDTLFSWFSS